MRAPAIRTTSIHDWSASALQAAKDRQRVAVVLPALNEERTIGTIVNAIREDLATGVGPLVDDIVVVDNNSTDLTAEVATAAGARVIQCGDIFPDLPFRRGKGEAMWRGVAATDADLVVFVDADLESFDSQFVVALLGPLLTDPAISFVKAGYARPPLDPLQPSVGGGRVTELMARPLINAFWPELADILQPLAGEYAARRSLLRRLPFRAGYGVDIGLLIDAYRTVGSDGLAQVDLRRRWHRHSDLAPLGRMAAEVLQTALDRLKSEGRIPADLHVENVLAQPDYTADPVRVAAHDIDTVERPPLDDVHGIDQPNRQPATK
ncbi:MAG: glucosyl-3-phosphoglycerate synthase [Frankiaceae bacterium]|nr:glucosyl-3-phosphoglycerate synthase [Frankiaceae bacterium]